MLTTERHQVSSYPAEPEAPPPEPSFSFPEAIATVLGFVQRRMLVIGLTFLIVTAIGEPIVLKLVPALYNATVTVLIDNRGAKFDPKTTGGIEWALLEAQIAIITSEPIRESVARKLHLADDSEFGNQKPGLLGTLLGTPRAASEEAREARAVGVLASNLAAKRTGANFVIEISYKSRNAERASDVANAFADVYINDEVQQSIDVSKRYREWLLPTINEVGDQLTELQRKISEFKAANNIVEAGENGRTVGDQQLADLGAQQIAARQRLSDAKVKLARVEELISANVDGAALEAAITDAVKSDVFTTLRTKYLDKKKLEHQFASRVGPNHEVAIRLRAEMDELRNEMRDELKRVAETYRNEVDASKRAEDVLQREISQAQSNSVFTNDKLVTLRKWESDYKSLQEIYNDKQKEYRARLQQETFPIPPARVLTKATPPGAKDYRKLLLGLAVVPAGGLGLGVALAFFLEMMDDVFHTERQIQKALGVKCLAIVPILKETVHGPNSGWSTPPGVAAARTILRDQTPLWSVSDSPFSYFAESVRLIKAAADLAGAGVKVIGLTSAVPNEGKSTIAASLAQATAQSGSRVILVDCDLRNPSLTASLAPVAERGLVDVISGRAALNDVIWTDPTTGMVFLPTVMKSRVAQTNEILASDATKRLFDTLRLSYDYVIVDLSPLAPVVDVRATAGLVDAYVFVVEWGRTHTSIVRRTLEGAPTVSDSLLGVVLNKTDMKLLRRYDSHLTKYHEKGYYRY